ncbi:MAG: hypothetical protein ACK4VI_03045 [Alphaproteobacteria bacterium]
MAVSAIDTNNDMDIDSIAQKSIEGGFAKAAQPAAAHNDNRPITTAKDNKSSKSTASHSQIGLFVGTNAAAHYIASDILIDLAEHGISCKIFLTKVKPKNDKHRERLNRPEVQMQNFIEQLVITRGYPFLESHPTILTDDGELDPDLKYTPKQIADYYNAKGKVTITIEEIDDINAPEFIDRMAKDKTIERFYNLRNMQILGQNLINAIEGYNFPNGMKRQAINIHPGNVITFPGTHTVFWARYKKSPQNCWSMHVIDQGIDTGPFLHITSSLFKKGKTILQDLLGMVPRVSNMILDDINLFIMGIKRPEISQQTHNEYKNRPKKLYTYAEHKDYLDAQARGIHIYKNEIVQAYAKDYTGSLTSELSIGLQRVMAQDLLDWQKHYLTLYQAAYGTHPPEYDPQKPDDYFVKVPPPYVPPQPAQNPAAPPPPTPQDP